MLLTQGIPPVFIRFRQYAEMLYRSGKASLPSLQAQEEGCDDED
jgi:hypothetical protein